jgi:outer membrane receptor protein involved in Fe transport
MNQTQNNLAKAFFRSGRTVNDGGNSSGNSRGDHVPELRHKRTMHFWLVLLLSTFLCTGSLRRSQAQSANASVSGHVTDSTGALIADATVVLIETETHISETAKSNSDGLYIFPSVKPGSYGMSVSRTGFQTTTVAGLLLNVQQHLSRDITLEIGSSQQTVNVNAHSADQDIQRTTSELGTVIGDKQISELPLNGRNFTQLLTLTPGATPISTAQSAGVGINDLAVLGVPTANVAQPSIQGQTNRSNLYLLDGVVNTEFTGGVYVIPPIIDTMQEFKVQSHDDQAEYGGVLGGVVNVVTKSGTNNFHGAAWEFVRNNIFDARDSFADQHESSPGAFRQNQFGATIGGPVWIPKVYDGHNRTFFMFGYEGWRYVHAGELRYYVPTDAELGGDFSQSILTNPIYDPASTQADPASPSGYSRTQFQGNVIPANRIDATMESFLQQYIARPNLTGDPLYNAITTRSSSNFSDHYMIRIDEQLGSKDSLFFRYDRLNNSSLSPSSISASTGASVAAKNLAAGWTHIFTPKLLFDFRFGIARRPFDRYQTDTAGLGPMQKLGFNSVGGTTISLASPYPGAGFQTANTIESPVTNYTSSVTWVHGKHNFEFGMQYIRQGNDSNSPAYGGYTFTNDTTNNPNQVGTTGNSLAAALLGLPSQINNTTTVSNSNRVSSYGYYAQDSWNLLSNLTLTYGVRFDHRRPFSPSANTVVSGPNDRTGDWWIGLSSLPPPCTQTNQAPCIPGDGTLAGIDNGQHIMLSPYGRSWGPNPRWDDWGPRIGVAWRLDNKTVVTGGYGIVYDDLMGIEQDWKGFAGSWPATGSVTSSIATNQLGQGLTPIESTFSEVGHALPSADPWSAVTWYMSPYIHDPRSQQYNVTLERELSGTTTLSIGYVGSHSDRLSITGLWNTAKTPGPGSPAEVQARKPFPWFSATPFMSSDTGSSDYNGLQVKLNRRYSNGLQYLISYTWAKSLDVGGSGYFNVENGAGGSSVWQNYYDLKTARGVSAYNIPHFFSLAGQYDVPFGHNRRFFNQGLASYILGDWQFNTLVQLRSGQPYNLTVTGDVANIGESISWWNYARPNLIGNPKPAHQNKNEWFDPAAFAIPSYSYGNFPRSSLSSSHVATADVSLFKAFSIKDKVAINFRAEAFNVFNIQNYGVPADTNIGDPQAGVIQSNVTDPRQLQLGLHLSF